MSQQIFSEIVPTVTSGTQLATILNQFKDAVVSGFSGTTRPANLQAGGYWVDTTNDAGGFWDLKLYTGAADIVLLSINKNNLSASILSTDSQFEILKTSDDDLGPVLKFLKERIAGGGQVLANDEIAVVEFTGTRDDSVEAVQAKISVISTDNVTAAAQGSAIILEAVNTGTATLSEVLRVIDGKIGIGVATPAAKLHVDETFKISRSFDGQLNPPTTITSKRRVTGSGGIINNDWIANHYTYSTADTGAEVSVALQRVVAAENHLAASHGVSLSFQSVITGANALSEYMNVGVNITFARDVYATNLFATTFTGGVVDPTRLDVKKDTEANLTTYASTAANGQIVFATDTKAYFGVLDGEIAPLGGGAGGGSSLVWEKDNNGPITSIIDGIKVELFDDVSDHTMYALIAIPTGFRPGKPISLKNGLVASDSVVGNIKFTTLASIYRSGIVLGSGPVQHTSTNTEITVSGVANTLSSIGTLDLTDGVGEINSVAVAAGDKILIQLFRDSAGETSTAVGDAKLLINSFELSFS